MELAHSLLLNEEALKRIPESKRPVFVFEWLRFLDKVLAASQKSDIKGSQKRLVEQLTAQITESPGPPTRKLLARCLALIFSVGDTFDLFETINKCNDIIKNKDDSPSYLPSRLAAIACLGAMYEKLGRMTGRTYEDTVQILIKSLKNAESQGRFEIMQTLEKLVCGLGSAGSHTHKDIYKACRQAMTDRAMAVRQAAARCMHELVSEAPFMSTTELETVANLCFRALDGSNYDARCTIAKLLGNLMATAQAPKLPGAKTKPARLEDVLAVLASGFIKGTIGGFLKTSTAGEMIKGSNPVNREIRVGITHAYVEFIKCMGGLWLERNISVFLTHVLELVANPRATPSHVDAVYARKCVQFIMRSVIGGMLGEKAQIAAAKEICQVIVKQMNTVGEAAVEASEGKGQASELTASQHVLVCALHELGCLVLRLGTSASPLVAEPATGIIEPVVSVLIHPSHAARLSASWCLASIAVALPSQLTLLLDRCVERMDKLRSSPEAVAGYSSALAALLGGVYQCALGIPHSKGKQIFSIAEELLRTASQNSRLSLQRTQSGWLLLGALMTLGPSVIKNHLPRMLLLWRNAFPRSVRELESEKVRGEAFTWQVTLEGRAGALGAMYSFLLHCRDLVTEDVIRRMLAPLECALVMMTQLASVIKMYGTQLKASAATIRLRLYDVLSLLPPESFDGLYPNLLRELVAEFTLTDNPANTTTSQLRFMCHADDSVILGSWLQETDHKAIEDQMEPNRKVDKEYLQPNSASGSGTLEHDSQSLYIRCPPSEPIPGPLPLGVAVIDSSVKLYGVIFPHVAHKHRYQMLQHFNECIRQAKGPRQQAVQMNVFTAVLCALKSLAELKSSPGPDDVKKAAFSLIMDAMSSSNPILRCAAGEALGRMAQVVGDSKFIAEMAQHSFDKLKSARDVVSRTGHSLALGCLHRYVGGMGSNQHLNTSVSILLALAQDFNSPVVQVWALHALALIADSGGPMYRSYVEPTLSLVLQLLLSVPPAIVDVHQCLGKCLSALITSIGPELQGNSSAIGTARLYCLVCCAVMQAHPDSLVQAEAIACLQQLHMFAPRHLNLSNLVPHLCENLSSSHLLLRRAAVSCLRQLATREAGDVSSLALSLVVGQGKDSKTNSHIADTGLEGVLFGMLDTETDGQLLSDLRDTIDSLLQCLAIPNLARWLALLKDVLSASTDATNTDNDVDNGGDGDEEEADDIDVTFTAAEPETTHPSVAPRWPTRVFAVECLMKIISSCEEGEGQFDLQLAKELKEKTGKNNFLVLHLSDLIRMSFIAATSDSNQLRLVGLAALEEVIRRFAAVPEPEFPGHVILEQYQAQVGAALRPAFSPDTPSDVTAAACEVCSKWIGSGVARDLNDLRRVHQLLVSSLAKLGSVSGRPRAPLYNESASTMEKLAVIRAWAEVYIVAVDRELESKRKKEGRQNGEEVQPSGPGGWEDGEEHYEQHSGESLLSLVQPELENLSRHWFHALRDHALLSLPSEYSNQLPSEGGAFYHPDTVETAIGHYRKSWPSILHGLAIWLDYTGFDQAGAEPGNEKEEGKLTLGASAIQPANAPANMRARTMNQDRFFLILGISMEALCNSASRLEESTVQHCLRALRALLGTSWPRSQLGKDATLSRELLNVMHRVILTRDGVDIHNMALDVVQRVATAAKEHLDSQRAKQSENTDSKDGVKEGSEATSGEGGSNGDFPSQTSVVFATLEVCLCAIVRHIPALNPSSGSTGFQPPTHLTRMGSATFDLVARVMKLMMELLDLCSPVGAVTVLPTVLHLVTSIMKETCARGAVTPAPSLVQACLDVLTTACKYQVVPDNARDEDGEEMSNVKRDWARLLQSTMASILQYAHPGEDQAGTDLAVLVSMLSVFTTHCPKAVAGIKDLLEPTLDVYRQAWDSDSPANRLKCIQALTSILSHEDKNVPVPYIHCLAPRFIEQLNRPDAPQMLKSPADRELLLAELDCLEQLVAVVEDSRRVTMMALYVPILVSLLLEETTGAQASAEHRALSDRCLERLTELGRLYPDHLRTVMSASAQLKPRLEAAVRLRQKSQAEAKAKAAAKAAPQLNKPTITLKMDFSNFKT
ncbi:HEAT repeat-containing protein 5B [Aplysia californica]|uniref:HEAT repeat-containing protein 5B n=1 Tax=Aplysia californica TaxID=6500 RepID=A0ABM1A4T3_APLCA|nr:HEAT repeat-containing protein 5B [Aplysia californica]